MIWMVTLGAWWFSWNPSVFHWYFVSIHNCFFPEQLKIRNADLKYVESCCIILLAAASKWAGQALVSDSPGRIFKMISETRHWLSYLSSAFFHTPRWVSRYRHRRNSWLLAKIPRCPIRWGKGIVESSDCDWCRPYKNKKFKHVAMDEWESCIGLVENSIFSLDSIFKMLVLGNLFRAARVPVLKSLHVTGQAL